MLARVWQFAHYVVVIVVLVHSLHVDVGSIAKRVTETVHTVRRCVVII